MGGRQLLIFGVVLAVLAMACAPVGPAPAPATEIRRGGTVTIGGAQVASQLDPHKLALAVESELRGLLWESLVQYTQKGGEDLQPALAQSWKASDDLMSWTFNLRKGVRFNNGKELTAEHVKRSLDRAVDPQTAYKDRALLAMLKQVEVVDPFTVRLHLGSPSANLNAYLEKFAIMDLDALDQVNVNPVGTGPYMVKRFEPKETVVFVPNPHYWGGQPPLDEIRIVRTADPTAAVTSFLAGELDVVREPPWQTVKKLKERGDIEVLTAANNPVPMAIMLNNLTTPFSNQKARRAVAHAINRKLIVDTLYAGITQPANANVPVPSASKFFDSALPAYEFNLDKAKQFFADAGVTQGTTLTYLSTPVVAEYTPIGEILQSDFGKIGINLRIRTLEVGEFVAQFFPPPKQWPNTLILNFWTGAAPPFSMVTWEKRYEGNYKSEEFSSLLADAEKTASEAARINLYKRAQQVINRDSPAAMVHMFSVPLARHSRVVGLWLTPAGIPQYQNLARSP